MDCPVLKHATDLLVQEKINIEILDQILIGNGYTDNAIVAIDDVTTSLMKNKASVSFLYDDNGSEALGKVYLCEHAGIIKVNF
jgi:hypothetical protein